MKAALTIATHLLRVGSAWVPAACGLSLLAAPALAQDAALMDAFKQDVACTRPALAGVQANVDATTAPILNKVAALDAMAADPRTCDAIQEAAAELSATLASSETAATATTMMGARARMELALREADAQAASMRFEVGPPPPNLTRNAGAGS